MKEREVGSHSLEWRQALLRRIGALVFIIASSVCAGIGSGSAWLGWSLLFALCVICDLPYGRAN